MSEAIEGLPVERVVGRRFTEQLAGYIRTAFVHEAEFLAEFWLHGGHPELLECYMASERTKIVCVLHSGQHVTDTIRTGAFIEWCERVTPNAAVQGAQPRSGCVDPGTACWASARS